MTNREFYTAITTNKTLSEELRNFAAEAIAKMDEKNSKRAAKPSKTAIENAPIKENIVKYLGTVKRAIASEIGEKCGISTAKASALCLQLVKEGELSVEQVKIPKKDKVNAYSLIVKETDNEDELGEEVEGE